MTFPADSMTALEWQQRIVAARDFEGNGRIINEWYNQSQYRQRRLGFLHNHPGYKNITQLVPIVRADSDEIFTGQSLVLSCQAVRQRELECSIDPLLPFMTSSNTQTLDDFAIYPTAEWTPWTRIDVNPVFPSSPSERAVGDVQIPAPPKAQSAPPLSGMSGPDKARPTASSSSSSHPATVRQPDKAGAFNLTTPPSPCLTNQQTSKGILPTLESGPAGDVVCNGEAGLGAFASISPPDPRTIAMALATLGENPNEVQAPQLPNYVATDGVSALQNRPIAVPVKVPRGAKRPAPTERESLADPATAFGSRSSAPPSVEDFGLPPTNIAEGKANAPLIGGTKRSSDESEDANKVSNDIPSVLPPADNLPPPKKRPKLKGRAISPRSPPAHDSAPFNEEPIKQSAPAPRTRPKPTSTTLPGPGKTKGKQPAPTNNRKAKSKAQPAPAPASVPSAIPPTRIERIAAGSILPRTRPEALAAQTLRRSTTGTTMPELWSTALLTPAERAVGPVRCLCGATADDPSSATQAWIGCDDVQGRCGGSWQHVRCLGDAVSRAASERAKASYRYECQMCDPFRHRRGLQKVRTGNGVP